MRREILKREHVAGGEDDDAVGVGGAGEFGEGGEHWLEIFGGAVVGNDHDERTSGALLEENGDESFGGGVESGHTDPSRALAQMGGRTPEGRK
jgi:hypothetical protein